MFHRSRHRNNWRGMMARNYPSYAVRFWRMSCVLFAWQALDTQKVSHIAGQVSGGRHTALTSYEFELLWILHVCPDTSDSVSSNNRYLRLSHKVKSVVCHVPIEAKLQRSPFFFCFLLKVGVISKSEWSLEWKNKLKKSFLMLTAKYNAA